MGRISMCRIDRDEKSITDGRNSMGKSTGLEKKRSRLEKGHCPMCLEEKVWKAEQ